MFAIRVTQSNFHRILNESPIPERDLRAMIDEYDTPKRESAIYFVPQAPDADVITHNSWMTLPRKYLEEKYTFDDTKIDNQFVEIAHK